MSAPKKIGTLYVSVVALIASHRFGAPRFGFGNGWSVCGSNLQ